jgi:hypothetical protein
MFTVYFSIFLHIDCSIKLKHILRKTRNTLCEAKALFVAHIELFHLLNLLLMLILKWPKSVIN